MIPGIVVEAAQAMDSAPASHLALGALAMPLLLVGCLSTRGVNTEADAANPPWPHVAEGDTATFVRLNTLFAVVNVETVHLATASVVKTSKVDLLGEDFRRAHPRRFEVDGSLSPCGSYVALAVSTMDEKTGRTRDAEIRLYSVTPTGVVQQLARVDYRALLGFAGLANSPIHGWYTRIDVDEQGSVWLNPLPSGAAHVIVAESNLSRARVVDTLSPEEKQAWPSLIAIGAGSVLYSHGESAPWDGVYPTIEVVRRRGSEYIVEPYLGSRPEPSAWGELNEAAVRKLCTHTLGDEGTGRGLILFEQLRSDPAHPFLSHYYTGNPITSVDGRIIRAHLLRQGGPSGPGFIGSDSLIDVETASVKPVHR